MTSDPLATRSVLDFYQEGEFFLAVVALCLFLRGHSWFSSASTILIKTPLDGILIKPTDRSVFLQRHWRTDTDRTGPDPSNEPNWSRAQTSTSAAFLLRLLRKKKKKRVPESTERCRASWGTEACDALEDMQPVFSLATLETLSGKIGGSHRSLGRLAARLRMT